jgi:thiamine biosynthesis protein ThiS
MVITVNGEHRTLPPDVTVRDLLASLRLDSTPCAVEINKRLVPKREHEGTRVREGDGVEIVTLVGGG